MYIPFVKELQGLLNAGSILGSEPTGGSFKRWFWGVVVAIFPLGYGVFCLITGEARIVGRGWESATFRGAEAAGLSMAYISAGAFLHFRYFWGLHERLKDWSEKLVLLSTFGVISGFLYIFYRIFFR